jgi:hypothetical protein
MPPTKNFYERPQIGDIWTRVEGQGATARHHFGQIRSIDFVVNAKTGEESDWNAVLAHWRGKM